MAIINFDARAVEPDAGRIGAIPENWYKVSASKLEFGPTSGGDGEKIDAQFKVIEGEYKGAVIFNNFNMKNASEKAEKIGRSQFSAFCHAVNVLVVQTTEQLLNIPFMMKVKVETDITGQYDPKNVPSAYRPANDPIALAAIAAGGAKPVAAKVTPPAAQPAPAAQTTAWAAPADAAPAASVVASAPAQPWAQPAQAAAPAAAPAPVAVAPVVQAAPVLQAVPGAPYSIDALRASKWSDEQMVDKGYAIWFTPAPVAAPVAPAPAPAPAAPPADAGQPAWATAPVEAAAPPASAGPVAAPAAVVADPAAAAAVAGIAPPWMTNQA